MRGYKPILLAFLFLSLNVFGQGSLGTITNVARSVKSNANFSVYGNGANITGLSAGQVGAQPTNNNLTLLSIGNGSGLTNALGISTNINFQFGPVTNFNVFQVTTAGTFTVQGIYTNAGLLNGQCSWTNMTNPAVLFVSNTISTGTGGYGFTNTAGITYYRATALGPDGYPSTWAIVSGSSPRPNNNSQVLFETGGAFVYNPFIQLDSSAPFMLAPNQSNTTFWVEKWGNDAFGRPGLWPFATYNGAIRANSSNFPIRIGVGSFIPPLAASARAALKDGMAMIGVASPVSKLIDTNLFSGINSPTAFLAVTNNTYIKSMTIEGILSTSFPSVNVTNLTIEDCDLGHSNSIDCLYFGSPGAVYNLQCTRVNFKSSWDTSVSIASGTWLNCNWVIDGNGGTNKVGLHGLNVGGLTFTHTPNLTIKGGYMLLTNPPSPLVADGTYTNAAFYILGSNSTVRVEGLSITRPAANTTVFFNYVGSTNISGWYWDNGVYCTVERGVVTISGGITTNIQVLTALPGVFSTLYVTNGDIKNFTTP